MSVKQISVFLENKAGRLAHLTQVLGENNINIRALSLADTETFGIIRLIVDRPGEVYQLLKDMAFTVSQTEVLAIEIADEPGGLNRILTVLGENGVNLEYLYAFLEPKSTGAMVVLRIEDIDAAKQVLANHNIKTLQAADLYDL